MSRTIWLVRHGQRVDNVDKKWKENNPTKWDDPELTIRGKQQAHEVGKHFANMNIEAIITSPYTRCIETSCQIAAMMENKSTKICVEPGLQEPLDMSMDPPTVPTMDKIKEYSTQIDDSYKPVFEKLPAEPRGDLGCADRVVKTFQEICKKFPSGNIIIVSHGVPLANIHAFLKGHWKYVGQCTISKVTDMYGQSFRLDYWSDKKHLSQTHDLHEDEKIVPRQAPESA
ncbi:hypothetical protein CAEBREN_20837 [Caenorhabditis brenneri]|uniref:Uncharacterized protein n=1 Tax=Caenorhabditis brenneri TaxID=135651 RepID=G0NXJ7_CAEBE|nr:hypothetical protein CAEBREN_03656 [Caenorhabditis brenneri]EGT39556.1 hypothetical protein CAEBREN_20837 [Caenorhabditis brenneri]